MAAQLLLKALLTLVERIAKAPDRYSNTGPKPLVKESTSKRWFPFTKGQWCGALMFPLSGLQPIHELSGVIISYDRLILNPHKRNSAKLCLSHGYNFPSKRQLMLYMHWDHSVYGPSQCETTLQCNIVSHWLRPYPELCTYHSLWFDIIGLCGLWWVDFAHIRQGCFTENGVTIQLSQCLWSNPEKYGQRVVRVSNYRPA